MEMPELELNDDLLCQELSEPETAWCGGLLIEPDFDPEDL